MDKSKGDWWYARVGASPRPEAGELVNIGLILGNGEAADLEAASELPRLKGLVAPSERRVYEEMIAALRESIRDGKNLQVLRQTYGPQIKISEPRRLYSEPDDDLRGALRRKLLETPEEPGAAPSGPREEAEEELERVVSRVVQLGYEVTRRPTPRRLYKDRWKEVFPTSVPRLAYALRSKAQREDVLVDGVVIHADDPDYPVRTGQVSRIGRAFWEYRRAQETILRVVGRRVRTVGMIFNGHVAELPEVRDAKEYIQHVWDEDLDLLAEADREVDLERFRNALRNGEWG